MPVLVTGSGFIGCQIAKQLAQRGERVILLDIAPAMDRIETIVAPGTVDMVRGDVLDYGAMEELVRAAGVERIVHSAAILGKAAREHPPRTALVNVVGSANILELARRLKLERVVLCSSGTVMAAAMNGFEGTAVPEDVSLSIVSQPPITFYAATKLAMEYYIHLYARTYGVDAVAVRYGRVVGAFAGENLGEISSMLQGYMGPAARGETIVVEDPTWIWGGLDNFVDARDCATGTVAALYSPELKQRVYHVSNDRMLTYEEFLSALRGLYPDLKVDVRTKPGHQGRPAPVDLSAATRDFGYRPQYDLEQSLRYLAQCTGAVRP
jgi:UDP-glucose 4-epimerase